MKIIFYHMIGCGPCMAFGPHWDQFVQECDKTIETGKIESAEVDADAGIVGFPTVIAYSDNGQKLSEFKDRRTKESLLKWVNGLRNGQVGGEKKNDRKFQPTLNRIYPFLVEYRETLKLFHFQSLTYGQHKASDKTLKVFDQLFDDLCEVWQGELKRRINYSQKVLRIQLISQMNSDDMTEYTEEMVGLLNRIDVSDNVNSIRDELVSRLNQFVYLLSFN